MLPSSNLSMRDLTYCLELPTWKYGKAMPGHAGVKITWTRAAVICFNMFNVASLCGTFLVLTTTMVGLKFVMLLTRLARCVGGRHRTVMSGLDRGIS